MPSHLSFESCCNLGYHPVHWYANQHADTWADHDASRYALSSYDIEATDKQTQQTRDILRRLVAIAMEIAPDKAERRGKETPVGYHEPRITKYSKFVSLAMEAGHSLDSNLKCVKCKLQVNIQANVSQLEAVLHMTCVGDVSNKQPNVSLHTGAVHDACLLMFHSLAVHSSHTMATNNSIQVHFCTRCGAYGSPQRGRSVYLKRLCKKPTPAGKAALRDIELDIIPAGRSPSVQPSFLNRQQVYHKRRRQRGATREGVSFTSSAFKLALNNFRDNSSTDQVLKI